MVSSPPKTPKGSLGNRWAMARALRAMPARGFQSQPEPRSVGLYARGRQLIAGNALFGGQVVQLGAGSLWDIVQPDPGQADDIHGFRWLDDLAAVGDGAARVKAQGWLWEWIARYGNGKGPGWSPDLTGRRLIRWINHALFLLSGRDKAQSDAYYAQVTAQTVFLSRRMASPIRILSRGAERLGHGDLAQAIEQPRHQATSLAQRWARTRMIATATSTLGTTGTARSTSASTNCIVTECCALTTTASAHIARSTSRGLSRRAADPAR